MQFESLYPPVCITSPTKSDIYIIAGGNWHQVDRVYSWAELESMWIPIVYDNKPTKVKDIKEEPIRYSVQGSKGNQYEVVNDKGIWSCSCPAFGFARKQDCKHIKSVKN